MSILSSPHFLRRVLWADAASCLATGLLQVLLTGQLARLLGLPEALLTGTGLFLLVYAAAVAIVATRQPLPRPVVWVFVAGNLVWAIDCVALLLGGWVTPTLLGQAWILAQALTVAVLAELQFAGLRRTGPEAGALQKAW